MDTEQGDLAAPRQQEKELFDRRKAGLLDGIEIDRQFGEELIAALKEEVPASGLGKMAWFERTFDTSYRYGARRKNLAERFSDFMPAHQ